MMDQIENNIYESPKRSFQNENAPKSSCSIEQQDAPRRVKVNFWMEKTPSKTPHKNISDRYLPIRKTPVSSKDLHFDHLKWQGEDVAERSDRRGMSIVDVYKMEVLGETKKNRQANEIQSFSNGNILKFHEMEDQNKLNFPLQNHFHLQEQNFPMKTTKSRKINKIPMKVLDAPALYDDFYLNLVDWSSNNLLTVGLSNSVYIWNAGNSKVVRLLELSENDLVTGVSSSPSSNVLAVGTHSGQTQLWDCNRNKKISTYKGHTGRVGAIGWNSNNLFASGSRDKNILIRDTRSSSEFVTKLCGHRQEVCGLKWSFDTQQLASGGNDNRLNIWGLHSTAPTASILKHTAAVKALAWSPHQHGLLVSGGGTADRTIRFWNSTTGQQKQCIDVGSQVCNLMFAKNVNELVSTHGYSLNEINIWSMPQMEKIQTLTGHTYRVLYLAMSPDGTTIVTGAGDETLRFWNVFPKKEKQTKTKSQLTVDSICLR